MVHGPTFNTVFSWKQKEDAGGEASGGRDQESKVRRVRSLMQSVPPLAKNSVVIRSPASPWNWEGTLGDGGSLSGNIYPAWGRLLRLSLLKITSSESPSCQRWHILLLLTRAPARSWGTYSPFLKSASCISYILKWNHIVHILPALFPLKSLFCISIWYIFSIFNVCIIFHHVDAPWTKLIMGHTHCF